MFDLSIKIKNHKKSIKESTLNKYINDMNKMSKDLTNKQLENLKFLDDFDKVIEYLNKFSDHTQKTKLAAIVVSLDSYKGNEELSNKYRKIMIDTANDVNNKYKEGYKSEKQVKNFTSYEKLLDIQNELEKNVYDDKLDKKLNLSKSEFKLLTNWLISSLYSLIPPMRNDYSNMKVISKSEYDKLNIDEKKKHNYLVMGRNMFFSFNDYKTSSKHNEIINKIPSDLQKVIKLYLKHKPNDNNWFIYNIKGSRMSSNELGKRVTQIFSHDGKTIGVSLIRSIIISELVPREQIEFAAQLAKSMGHSTATQQGIYSKK